MTITQISKSLRAARAHHLSSTQLEVVCSIARNPDGISTPGEIHRDTGVSQPTVSVCLGALHDKGFIERTLHPSDARKNLIRLTREGSRALQSFTTAKA